MFRSEPEHTNNPTMGTFAKVVIGIIVFIMLMYAYSVYMIGSAVGTIADAGAGFIDKNAIPGLGVVNIDNPCFDACACPPPKKGVKNAAPGTCQFKCAQANPKVYKCIQGPFDAAAAGNKMIHGL